LKEIPTELKLRALSRWFFNLLPKEKYQRLGSRSYNHLEPVILEEQKLQLWFGYHLRFLSVQSEPKLNLDICCKVVRQETALDVIELAEEHAEKKGLNPESEIVEVLLGQQVVTRYNKRIYVVDRVDFKKCPVTDFELDGEQLTYREFVASHYNEVVTNSSQPLLVSLCRRTQ